MSQKIILAICGYVDGKHESQVGFSLGFCDWLRQLATQLNLNLEPRLIMIVGFDEISRKKDLHANFRHFEIGEVFSCDAIFDRIGTMVSTAGIMLDQAVYTGAQVFNRPISIDESKARDYMIARMLGFNVPRTVVVPQASYIRAKMVTNSDKQIEFDFDLDDAVNMVGGYPCFLKKANGGGRAHVYKVKNKAELFDAYQTTREHLMVLQEMIDFDRYIRTFCFGRRVIHTTYDIDKPDGQKYGWPDGQLTDQERLYLDKIMPMLCQELATPFCTMEIARSKKDGQWYFIDITNGCNFDMREGELSAPVFSVAKTVLLEELADWAINPRPMIVHTHLQKYVLRQQLYRASVKKQNPCYLWDYAKEIGLSISEAELSEGVKKFEERYWKTFK